LTFKDIPEKPLAFQQKMTASSLASLVNSAFHLLSSPTQMPPLLLLSFLPTDLTPRESQMSWTPSRRSETKSPTSSMRSPMRLLDSDWEGAAAELVGAAEEGAAAEVLTSWALNAAAELVGAASEVFCSATGVGVVAWAAGVGVGEAKTELQLTFSQLTSFRS
jgi:hypothetical protein